MRPFWHNMASWAEKPHGSLELPQYCHNNKSNNNDNNNNDNNSNRKALGNTDVLAQIFKG